MCVDSVRPLTCMRGPVTEYSVRLKDCDNVCDYTGEAVTLCMTVCDDIRDHVGGWVSRLI